MSVKAARVYRSTTQSIASNSTPTTAVSFDGERFDTDSFHDPGTNPERLTAPANGKYLIGATIAIGGPASGTRKLAIRKNGGTFLVQEESWMTGGSDPTSVHHVVVLADLATSDYVEFLIAQATGSNQNVAASNGWEAEAWIVELTGSTAMVNRSTNQGITQSTQTVLTFDSEAWDDSAFHSTVTNTGRLTIPSDGDYVFGGHIDFTASVSGSRTFVEVLLNGTTVIWRKDKRSFGTDSMNVAGMRRLSAGDYLELRVYKDSSGTHNVAAAAAGGTPDKNNGFWIAELPNSGTGYVHVNRSANKSISASTRTAIDYDQERQDDGAFHDTSTNKERITVPTNWSGHWLTVADVSENNFSANVLTEASIRVNGGGGVEYARERYNHITYECFNVMTLLELATSDYIEVLTYQEDSVSENVLNDAQFGLEFAAAFLDNLPASTTRISQEAIEVLGGDGGDVRLSQEAVEVLGGDGGDVRVSQLAVEVLLATPEIFFKRITRFRN